MKKIMYRLMLIGLLLLFGTKAKAVQEADNVLYLPFDEGEGKTAKDASPHKNDGIFQENAKWAKGKYGNSLSLDGDKGDWVEVPDSPSLDITDQITLMAWVYPTRFTAAWYRIVVKHWEKNEAPWMVYGLGQVGGTNGKTSFIISVDGGTEGRLDPSPFGPEGDKPEDTPALKPKVWTHLASTYDGKEMKLYYDGEVVAKKSIEGKLDTNDVSLAIGGNNIQNHEYYPGRIDEVAIWKVALSKNEIQEAMERVYAIESQSKLSTSWGFVKKQYIE